MNLLKGCLEHISENDGTWESLPGVIVTDDWRPFSYIALILDYKDIIEKNLYENNCNIFISKLYLQLHTNDNYKIKTVKLPKFNNIWFSKFITVIQLSINEILESGGKDYLYQFKEISKLSAEE